MTGSRRIELGENLLLDLHPLRYRFDGEIDVAKAVVLRRSGDEAKRVLEVALRLLLGQLLLGDQPPKLILRDLAGLRQTLVDEALIDVLQHYRQIRSRQNLGNLAAHRPGSHHRRFEHEHRLFQPPIAWERPTVKSL